MHRQVGLVSGRLGAAVLVLYCSARGAEDPKAARASAKSS